MKRGAMKQDEILRWRAAGILSKDGETFEFYKCPFHDTWMQPELVPYPHWSCKSKDYCKEAHPVPDHTGATRARVTCQGHACTFKKAAKMRTSIERRIFSIAKFLEENG